MQKNNKENIKQFFEGWQLYSAVIEHNYMMHKEIIAFLRERLRNLNKTGLHILEVGCGDAHAISQIAKQVDIKHYTGIDLSEMALGFAEEKLGNRIKYIQLISGDMTEKIHAASERYDVIIAGYSMHHLNSQQKGQLFANFKQRLNNNGLLIIYDLVQNENESSQQYIKRALDNFETHWTALSQQQLVSVFEHVSQNDIPESWQGWRKLAEQNGFPSQDLVLRDKHNIYGIMEFS